MSTVISYLLQMALPLMLKTGMYYGVFRWQRIPATLLNCVIIAGSGVIASVIPLFFIPEPVVVIGLATYLCSKFTGIDLFPNALVITLIVEFIAHAVVRYVLLPIIGIL